MKNTNGVKIKRNQTFTPFDYSNTTPQMIYGIQYTMYQNLADDNSHQYDLRHEHHTK